MQKIGFLKNKSNMMIVKKIFYTKNIKHRNSFSTQWSTLLKQSKKRFYNNCLNNNINNIKNTWKEIKSIIYLKTKESDSSKIILNNNS